MLSCIRWNVNTISPHQVPDTVLPKYKGLCVEVLDAINDAKKRPVMKDEHVF